MAIIDLVRYLKIENPAEGGTQTDYIPTEGNPASDYGNMKGVVFDSVSSNRIEGVSGQQMFYDAVSGNTSGWSLTDLARRLYGKDVAPGTPPDGHVLTWIAARHRWEAAANGSASGGVVPPFVFSKDGHCTVGTYLRTGVVPGGAGGSGQLILGTNKLIGLDMRTSANVATKTRFQMARRTAVNTWSDIAGAFVEINAGSYVGTVDLNISIGADWEVSFYNKSGSTTNNTVLVSYFTPV